MYLVGLGKPIHIGVIYTNTLQKANSILLNIVVMQAIWESCFGLPLVATSDSNVVTFDTPPAGSIYIAHSSGENEINYCEFGLKVNLTVQSQDCLAADAVNFCSSHGSCQIETYTQSTYSCVCEYGYYQQYCEEYDSCINSSCKNGGSCVDVIAGMTAANFTCECPDGYAGMYVE